MGYSLALTLLVAGVLADHAHTAVALDDLALRTDLLNRSTYFHFSLSFCPRGRLVERGALFGS